MLIFSDLHAHNFKAITDNRLDICVAVLSHILTHARTLKTPVLFCGDIIHNHAGVPIPVLLKLFATLKQFSDVPIFCISGNHDQETINTIATPSNTFTDVLPILFNNIVCLDYKSIELQNKYVVTGIPYMSKSADFYRAVDECKKVDGKINILLCHQTPTKLFNPYIPTEIDIEYAGLNKFDFVFMGHIHRYQELIPNRYMVGNPLVQDQGDAIDIKGYLELVDTTVTQHTITTELTAKIVVELDAKKGVLKALEKQATVVDSRMYSDNINDKLVAYCEAQKIPDEVKRVGLNILNKA